MRGKRIIGIAAGLALAAILGGTAALFPFAGMREAAAPAAGQWQVHLIDVGNADAILLRSAKQAMLVDAAKASDADRIAAYLKRNGITRLDLLAVTHPDADHVGGAETVLRLVKVDRVIGTAACLATSACAALCRQAEKAGAAVTAVTAGDRLTIGDATVEVLGPRKVFDNDNDNSLILRWIYKRRAVLLVGDAEAEAEQALLETPDRLAADLLKVGHHGGDHASGLAFLQAVRPAYALISCGADNPFDHPAAAVLDRLAGVGATVLRTDRAGTVILQTDGDAPFVQIG